MSKRNRYVKTKEPKDHDRVVVDPNAIPTRDPMILALIGGATKSGAFRNHKKHGNKYAARQKVRTDDF